MKIFLSKAQQKYAMFRSIIRWRANHRLRTVALGLLLVLSMGASAQQALPNVPDHLANNTIYQVFYWDSYPGLWSDLPTMAQPLADAGITSMWLPPAVKANAGTNSVGYDPYDFWELGEL